MDHNGEFRNEMSGKLPSSEEIIAARFEEIKHLHSYDVYEKVPIDQCCNSTGRTLMTIKWVDINQGDKVYHDYRSRLVAKELKLDKRLDLFAPTTPLEAKKVLFSAAATEGIGYKHGDWNSGMKLNFIDISRAFFQADAARYCLRGFAQ